MKQSITMKTKTCKIEGCEGPHCAFGLCDMHYNRVRSGISDMRPGKLPKSPWAKDNPKRRENKGCSVPGCEKPHYAKGLCCVHYARNLRNGNLIYKKDLPKPKCSVAGCEELILAKGLCSLHYSRKHNGTPLHRPKGIKGPLNHNWNGGVAEYPNHYKMKKMRLIVLEEANYTCHYCGKPTNQIHHKDQSKDNHSENNIVACCQSCNLKGERSKISDSKYRRLYNKTLKELANELKVSIWTIRRKHKQGKLTAYIRQDIQYYLSAI